MYNNIGTFTTKYGTYNKSIIIIRLKIYCKL